MSSLVLYALPVTVGPLTMFFLEFRMQKARVESLFSRPQHRTTSQLDAVVQLFAIFSLVIVFTETVSGSSAVVLLTAAIGALLVTLGRPSKAHG